ncbi:MAG: signal recognition particle-docking protein FtsY [Puniceicoccales bacterium]|nr:signal recognition particle-docking protein FtsY [Puniceicoccales bacterium]
MFGLFKKFCQGLSKTKRHLAQKLGGIFRSGRLRPESLESLEEALYAADFGVETTGEILSRIRQAFGENPQVQDIVAVTIQVLRQLLEGSEGCLAPPVEGQPPEVIYLVGTNGSGKTTSAAKCAHFFQAQGRKVLVGACDTFRVAANEQLAIWSRRLGFELVASRQGADAAAVAYDSYRAACHRRKDLLLLDTAGRLHTKEGLMQELLKIRRVLQKHGEPAAEHVWLVLDGSLGINSISSARQFHQTLGLSGLIMTKLDGTSRGGALVGIYHQLHIPIYFIGLGEKADDLQPFSREDYIRALLEEPSDEET